MYIIERDGEVAQIGFISESLNDMNIRDFYYTIELANRIALKYDITLQLITDHSKLLQLSQERIQQYIIIRRNFIKRERVDYLSIPIRERLAHYKFLKAISTHSKIKLFN